MGTTEALTLLMYPSENSPAPHAMTGTMAFRNGWRGASTATASCWAVASDSADFFLRKLSMVASGSTRLAPKQLLDCASSHTQKVRGTSDNATKGERSRKPGARGREGRRVLCESAQGVKNPRHDESRITWELIRYLFGRSQGRPFGDRHTQMGTICAVLPCLAFASLLPSFP